MNRLDTETKAILQKVPEDEVLCKAAEFGLVLLRRDGWEIECDAVRVATEVAEG